MFCFIYLFSDSFPHIFLIGNFLKVKKYNSDAWETIDRTIYHKTNMKNQQVYTKKDIGLELQIWQDGKYLSCDNKKCE